MTNQEQLLRCRNVHTAYTMILNIHFTGGPATFIAIFFYTCETETQIKYISYTVHVNINRNHSIEFVRDNA